MADSLARSAFGSASVFPPAYQKMGEELAEAARGVFQATCSVVARRAHAFALREKEFRKRGANTISPLQLHWHQGLGGPSILLVRSPSWEPTRSLTVA